MEKTVPTHVDLMYPTLEAIKKLGGSGTNEEIFDKLVEIEKFPEEVQAVQHNERRSKLEYRSFWARSWLKKINAIDNSQAGVWSITNVGEQITKDDIQKKLKEVRQIYYQKRKLKQKDTAVRDDEDISVDVSDGWKEQLLDVLKNITPDAFERLSQRLLRESGFVKVEVTGKSGDGGIDGVGVLRVNLISFQVSFQCKRYQASVGSGAIRDFRGAMIGRCDKGLVITTGSFSRDARQEAVRDGAPTIDLIDGEELCDLLKKLNLGVETKMTESVEIKPEWFKDI